MVWFGTIEVTIRRWECELQGRDLPEVWGDASAVFHAPLEEERSVRVALEAIDEQR